MRFSHENSFSSSFSIMSLFDAPNDQQNDDRRVGTELGAA
jgi:hypothetical protein